MSSDDQYFKKPNQNNLHLFFKFHPKQPVNDVTFNPIIAFYRKTNSQAFKREWLSYCSKSHNFFCSFCLAFGNEDNRFTVGCTAAYSNNCYARIKEHEKSNEHENCCEAFLLYSKSSNIKHHFESGRLFEIQRKRAVLQRVIDTIKLIGKRGLSYRGAKTAEAAYTLIDDTLDHGNFLEILKLISNYDPLLKQHIEDVVHKSQKFKKNKSQTMAGRSGLITLISKTTADYVLEVLGTLMRQSISKEIKESGFYSVQIDSTQDINVHDQLSIIIRFVDNKVKERLVALVDSKSNTGKDLFDTVNMVLKQLNLDVKDCVGSSTDGASNMQGQYNGFTAWLNKEAPNQVHVHCYAHVLNLVMTDTTKVCCESVSLFGLLNTCAVFVRESYLRMAKWESTSKFKFISVIGETRWWAKDRCLSKVFGNFKNYENALFPDIILTMHEIFVSEKFVPDVRYRAKTLIDSLLKYETILTAHVFLQIFVSTTPVSLYLQTRGMNVMQAFTMVNKTIDDLKCQSRNLDGTIDIVNTYVKEINKKLEERSLEYSIPETFISKRNKKQKKVPGENASDESITDPKKKYRVNVYNLIYDQVITSFEKRFIKHDELYKNMYYLDPNNFFAFENASISSFEWTSSVLTRFDPEINAGNIYSELQDFIKKWPVIKNVAIRDITTTEIAASDEEQEDETNDVNESYLSQSKILSLCKTSCKNCILCCFEVLQQYRLHTSAYSNLYLVYKYIMTLSCTQISCETTFSKLKFVQNKLRNCMSQNKLENFLLMSIEKDVLVNINNEDVIDLIAQKSMLLSKLLL